MIKKHIPNAITCLNLLSGSLAIVYTLHSGDVATASLLIILAAVFDFFDGMVARLLKVSSPIGKDLDSLADVISFGLAPACLLVHGLWQSDADFTLGLFPLLIAAAAALRLAKFNNDTRQSTSFIGLPVPANALFWIGLQSILPQIELMIGLTPLIILVYALVLIFSYLMLSELPMFSFKFKGGQSIKDLAPQIALILISIISAVFAGMLACSIAIVAYILLSLFSTSSAQPTGATK